MAKQQLWLAEAIQHDSGITEITVELRGGYITDEVRERWRKHGLIRSVSVRTNDNPRRYATIIVPFGARSELETDSLIEELGNMIPQK